MRMRIGKHSSRPQSGPYPGRFAFLSLSLVLFLFFCPPVSLGEVPAERILSLDEALKLSLENNHELRALQRASLAQQADVGVARSHFLPKLTFEERFFRTDNPGYAFMTKLNQERIAQQDFNPFLLNNPDPISDFQTMLYIEQPLFVRRALLGLNMSRQELQAKEEDLRRKRQEVAFGIVRAYLMVGTAKGQMAVAEKAVAEGKEHLRIAELRYKSGLGQYSDVLRASTSLAEGEQRLVSAAKNLSLAKRGLGLAMGKSEAFDVSGDWRDIPLQDLGHYTDASLTRSDVRSASLRSEKASAGIKLAEAGYFPYLGVSGAYQFNDHNRPFGSEGNSWQVAAFLRWDLFDGTKREYERIKAMHQAAEAQEHLAGLKKAVSYRIYEAYLGIEEAKQIMNLARAALLTAEEGRRLVRLRFEGGLSPLVDLLSTQASLEQARANLVARENDYRLAVMALSHESGTLLTDLRLDP